jgi:hypothetical protein
VKLIGNQRSSGRSPPPGATGRGLPFSSKMAKTLRRIGQPARHCSRSFQQINGRVLISRVLRRSPLNRLEALGSFGR